VWGRLLKEGLWRRDSWEQSVRKIDIRRNGSREHRGMGMGPVEGKDRPREGRWYRIGSA